MTSYKQNVLAVASALIFIILCMAIYWPGLAGDFYLDALPNLKGIKNGSVLDFILSGRSGPGGRPLSLATFLLTPDAFPDNPQSVKLLNLIIHLFNGVLVFGFLFLLGQHLKISKSRALLIAVSSAVIFIIHPINSTVVLITVQRMTSLSALFVLLGLITYLYGRLRLESEPRKAYFIMSLGIGAGTILAVFSKENGVLLPLFVLVIEMTLLRHTNTVKFAPYWRSWLAIFVVLPCLAVLCYLAIKWPQYSSYYDLKPFSLSERILTQPRVLLDYFQQFLMPRADKITPFQDAYRKSTTLLSPPGTLIALVLALVSMVSAFVLRKKFPLFSFAVAWFFAGHVLESTVVPLELYYEHRNYLPLVGPLFAITTAITGQTLIDKKIPAVIAVIWGGLLVTVLYSVNMTWGQEEIAAEVWYLRNPQSMRAAQYLVAKKIEKGEIGAGAIILQDIYSKHPDSTLPPLQLFKLKCSIDEINSFHIESLSKHLERSNFEASYGPVLENFFDVVQNDQCPGVELADIYKFIQSLMRNANYQKMPGAMYNLHMLVTKYAVLTRNLSLAIINFEDAREFDADFSTFRVPAILLMSAGLEEEAERQFQLIDSYMPLSPLKKYLWIEKKNELRSNLDTIKQNIKKARERNEQVSS